MNDENMTTLLNGKKIVNLDKRNRAWEKTRERGQVAYILRDVLITGGSVFVFRVGFGAYHHHPLGKILLDSIAPTLEGLFAGFIGGIWTWSSNESRYQKAFGQEPSTHEILSK
jgi:hypothetical protein